MILCHSSGSTCSERSIDPFTSAKSTVTCLRSPSRAERDVRIFSARCFGVYERGSGRAGAELPVAIGWPHVLQNFADEGSSVLQCVQRSAKLDPHSRQKREPSGFA